LFDTAFGTQYDYLTAFTLKSQWQSHDFSSFPQIEVVSSEVLGTARGAYAISTNTIYLSDAFISSASQQSLEAVILEEYGHFVDAQVNQTDTAGDEGELFSDLVRGVNLSTAELSRIKTENDWATLSLNGNSVPVELSATYPNMPWITGSYNSQGYYDDVQIMGNSAYITNYYYDYSSNAHYSLQTIGIGNPASPAIKASYVLPSYAQDVEIVGNLAYIADFTSGLQIIDISNPALPTFKGSYDTPAYAYDVQIVGNLAYIADYNSGLQIIDISNPASPTLKGSYDTSGNAYGVQIVGNYAYVADNASGLQIIDISNPAAPTLKGSYDTSGTAYGVQIVGNYAYIADNASGLQIIDISNPAKPTFKGSYDTPGYAYDVQIVGNLAYIADNASGLQIIDISNPSPLKGNYDTPGNARNLQIVGNLAYIADYSSLQIIDISNPASSIFKGSYNAGYASNLQIVGNLAYIADGSLGLQVVNISNPTAPSFQDSYDTPGDAQDVQIVGGLAYVADSDSGLQIIDISNPAYSTLKGSYNTPGNARNLQIVGNLAYIADYSSLQIIDITNPASPTLKGSYNTFNAQDVQIVGNLAYLADYSGLQIIDISNPTSPTLKGNYSTPNYAQSVEIVGNLAYIADDDSGIQIIDITNPAAPTFKAFYGTPGAALGVKVVGSTVYAASDTNGVSIFGAYSSGTTLSLAATNAVQTEGNSGSKAFTFTVTRTGDITATNTVNWAVTGTGTNPAAAADFAGGVLPSGTVSFAANSTSQVISVSVNGDTTVEPDETFTVTLSSPSNGATLSTATATGTITNDDLPSITLAVAPTSVNEDGTTNLVYTFTRTAPTTSPLTVNYGITGTADATDYTGATPGTGKTITFAANSATATLTIDPTADTTIESNDTVALTLATGTGYTVGTTTAVTGTITNDDLPSITLAVAPSSVTEDGTTNLVYTFTRTGPTTSTLTVNYGITGTADTTDYTGATPGTSKTITFAANSATATLTIDPTADTTIEANETVALTLATGTGYVIGTTTAVTGTITDDDTSVPSISLGLNYGGISENSPSNFIYTFTRTGSTTNALTVNYGITGTADATDYTGATPGTGKTIIFSAGAATATLALDSIGDTSVETDETISLQLATGTGYTVGTSAAQIATIINDDGTRRQKGTNGKDVILGTNLGDILSGGLGNDTLAGSDGGDSFLFNATNEGIDTITDFSVGSDYLLIKGSAFGGGLVSGDTITSAQFIIGTAATNASQRFIYNATNGALFFDVDGNGATSAIQFATLSPKLGLTFEDIFIS
jgi:Ca2+-binding RTX toxin-like protein